MLIQSRRSAQASLANLGDGCHVGQLAPRARLLGAAPLVAGGCCGPLGLPSALLLAHYVTDVVALEGQALTAGVKELLVGGLADDGGRLLEEVLVLAGAPGWSAAGTGAGAGDAVGVVLEGVAEEVGVGEERRRARALRVVAVERTPPRPRGEGAGGVLVAQGTSRGNGHGGRDGRAQ